MVLTSTLLMLAATPAPPPPDPVLRQLAETRKFQNGAPNSLKMDRSGAHVFFLRSPADSPVQSLHVFEVDAGQARELLSADALLKGTAQQLSAEEKAQLERRRVAARGLVSYELSDDGKTVIAPLSGRLYRVDVAGLLAGRTVEQSVKALPPTGVLDPRLSPDAKTVSYVKGGDLFVTDLAGGKERRLTTGGSDRLTHGLAEFVAQEEMGRFDGAWWGPDSKQIAYEDADTRGVETVHPRRPRASGIRVPDGALPASGEGERQGPAGHRPRDRKREDHLGEVGRGKVPLPHAGAVAAQGPAHRLRDGPGAAACAPPRGGPEDRWHPDVARGAGPGVDQPPAVRSRPPG
jgi:hypothetical protein